MVSLEQAVFAGVTGLFGLAGMWVLAARPRERTNQLLAAALVLLAGSSLAFMAFRGTAVAEERLAYLRIIAWYEVPVSFLLLVALDELFLPRPRTRARKAALGAAGLLSGAMLALLVLAPSLYTTGFVWTMPVPGPLGLAQQGLLFLVETVAVVLAARRTRDPEAGPLQRRQAAVVGLGFAALLLHAGGGAARSLFLGAGTPMDNDPLLAASLAESVVVLTCLPSLLRVFEGRWRAVAVAAAALPVLGVVYEAASFVLAPQLVFPRGTRPFWQGLFALALALAVVRYGLAGVVPDARRHVARVSALALALGAVAAGVALGLDAFGPTPLVAGAGLLGMIAVPVALLKTPLQGVPRRLAERVVLDAARPEVTAERLRVYLAALRSARGPDGRPTAEGERVLRELRAELRISEDDHWVLLDLLEQPAQREAGARVLFGRYALERQLGRGGSGVVTLARDLVIGRQVVIKQLDAGGRPEHLLAEMRALGRLHHPRVLTLFHAEQVGDTVFLVLEHAPGGSVGERLAKGPLPAPDALAIADDVLGALEAVHGAGLVHGDVKVGNVLLGADGRAKLADFGAVRARRAVADPDATVRLPDSMATIGSAAPEQLRGERPSPATDLYSVGVLAYRMLAGEHYLDFEGLGEAAAMQRVLTAPPRLPHKRVPARVEAVLSRALAKDPSQRFATAAEMREALAAAQRPRARTEAAPAKRGR